MQQRVNRDSSAPMGAYQVWHREGDEFRQVGSLKVGNLQAAAEVAMQRPPASWMGLDEGDKVPDDQRRTGTGDVIVSPDGEAFLLKETKYGFTFDAVNFDQLRQNAREAAEYREEARAGVRDGLRFGGKFAEIMEEARVYGIKPEEVAQIREEVERDQGGMEL